MKIQDVIVERTDPRAEIENMAAILPGRQDEYFVRFTDQDKIGFSAQQHFGRTPDVGDPGFGSDSLPQKKGRPALWFYPLKTYLENPDLYASGHPYTWLVRLHPDAWLEKLGHGDQVPSGHRRVGYISRDQGVPMAVFFQPAFDVVDRWHTSKNKSPLK